MEAILKLIFLFLTLFLVFLLGLRFYAYYRLNRMKGRNLELIDTGIVYFYSQRCGACKVMTPNVERLKDKLKVVMIDVFSQEGSKVAKSLGIIATPTTLLVKNGRVFKSFVGVVSPDKILKAFEH